MNKQRPGPAVTAAPSNRHPTSPVVSGQDGWALTETLTALFYGEAGTGKTTLWATFPGPILTLICSGGSRPGELKSVDTPENRRKITPRVVRSTDQFEEYMAGAATQFATTVLDHVSGLLSLVVKEHLGLDDLPAVKKWAMLKQAEWGVVNEKVIALLRSLLNLPGNVVLIAQERIFKAREDGISDPGIVKPVIGAAVTPGVAQWLNPAVDYAGQTFKRPKMKEVQTVVGTETVTTQQRLKGVEYCLRTEPHDIYYTKFRVPRGQGREPIPEVIVDPTYDKILKVIRGEKL